MFHCKKIFVILSLLLPSAFVFSQNIRYFFKILPTAYIEELNDKTKDSILEGKAYYPATNDSEEVVVYKLEQLDLNKEFLRIEMSFETGQRAVLIYELRSFRATDGNFVVVFSNVSDVPHESTQNSLIVFSYNKSKGLKPIKTSGLIAKPDIKYFLTSQAPDSIIKRYVNYASVVYELSYEGKNIALRLEGNGEIEEKDKKWFAGDIIEFVWKGDHFIQQKPIFKD